MNLSFSSADTKEHAFNTIENYLHTNHFVIAGQDRQRPWGGFFVIDEENAERFINKFFPQLQKKDLLLGNKLSPKILVVAPQKRLSWQYHHRRAEIWKLIGGTAGVATSDSDEEKETIELNIGDIVQLKQGQRHRLIGLKEWGVVAEIWQHTDVHHPSDEEDIVRLQDDFGR